MEGQAKAELKRTLSNAVSELNKLSWKLNGLVFGESVAEKKTPETPQEVAGNKVTELRNEVDDVNTRLRSAISRLEEL